MTQSALQAEHHSRHTRNRMLLCVMYLAGLLMSAPHAAAQHEDTRRVHNTASPAWLDAIVRLEVPGVRYRDGLRRHHTEDCSATLVSAYPSRRVDTVITAWHCLEMYRDLSKRLIVTLTDKRGEALSREVYKLADGGGMHADWAILRMYDAPPAGSVTALNIHPGSAEHGQPVTMAGFSKDPGLGQGGKHLTFDPACHITKEERSATATDCAAFKGASGGCRRADVTCGHSAVGGRDITGQWRELQFLRAGCTFSGSAGEPFGAARSTAVLTRGGWRADVSLTPVSGEFDLLLPLTEAALLVIGQRVETQWTANPFLVQI